MNYAFFTALRSADFGQIKTIRWGSVRTVWGLVLFMAFGAALDPMRLGIAVLLISRPRPVLTLLAFWLGGMATGLVGALVVLLLLREAAAPLSQHLAAMASGGWVGPLQIAGGVLALLIGAKLAMNVAARQRAPVPVPVPVNDLPTLTPEPATQKALARISGRLRTALEGGNLWVAFVVGLGSATPPIETLVLFTAILASGAAIEVQLGAALVFTVVAFAVIEIPLLTYLVRPAKTQAVMEQLQLWIRARRSQIIAGFLLVTGAALVAAGTGLV